MLVLEAMNKDVKTIRPDATVKEAAGIMREHRIGSLVVISPSGAIGGIVTEHDILANVVATGKDSASTKVSDIMTEKVVTVGPQQSLEDAADIMVKNRIKKLPVVERGVLVGIITASDLITYERRLIEKVATLLATSPMQRVGG